MATVPPIIAGSVDWSGENPGMSLKEATEGPFVTLLSFFRVVLSPHGRGHALVMLRSPRTQGSSAGAENVCITDNEPLAHWLISDYLSYFGAFQDLPALRGLAYESLIDIEASGDPFSSYAETVRSRDLEVRLSWEELGEPFAVHLPVDQVGDRNARDVECVRQRRPGRGNRQRRCPAGPADNARHGGTGDQDNLPGFL